MNNKIFCLVFFVFYVASTHTNAQYFSAPEGITIGRLGKRKLDNNLKEKTLEFNDQFLQLIKELTSEHNLQSDDDNLDDESSSYETLDYSPKQYLINKLESKLKNSQTKPQM